MSEPIWADDLKNLDTPSSPEPLGLAGGSHPCAREGQPPPPDNHSKASLGRKDWKDNLCLPLDLPTSTRSS